MATSSPSSYSGVLAEAWTQHLAPRESDAPTVISLFAGAGGSSLGYSMAGFRELLAVECDANAVETFKANFHEVPVYHGDVSKLSVEEVMARTSLKSGELDVLDGSPPCQGFSTAGKREMGDSRNQLFREYVRLLRGLRPKAFIMENVSGMVKGKMKLIFVEILKELKASGYKVSARLVNAMYFCVPQSRPRMIFVGVRDNIAAIPTHPPAESCGIVLQAALSGLIDGEQKAPGLYPNQLKNYAETRRGSSHHKRFSLNRLAWDSVAPTILKPSGSGGHMHPDDPRLLSTAELRRVASFPDGFTFKGSWNDSVNRIGNSVPPLLMRAIARHVRENILNKAVCADV